MYCRLVTESTKCVPAEAIYMCLCMCNWRLYCIIFSQWNWWHVFLCLACSFWCVSRRQSATLRKFRFRYSLSICCSKFFLFNSWFYVVLGSISCSTNNISAFDFLPRRVLILKWSDFDFHKCCTHQGYNGFSCKIRQHLSANKMLTKLSLLSALVINFEF